MPTNVTIEFMPDDLKSSHRAGGSWGEYPHNGSVREEMSESDAEDMVEGDEDGYAHIVPARRPAAPGSIDSILAANHTI